MIYEVVVQAEWRSTHTYEFDSEEKAQEFAASAQQGDLEAIVAQGDITPDHTSELMNWDCDGWVEETSNDRF